MLTVNKIYFLFWIMVKTNRKIHCVSFRRYCSTQSFCGNHRPGRFWGSQQHLRRFPMYTTPLWILTHLA